ncbi:MAG: peptide deformylase [Bacteroidota bacterium]|nr:peptide deformylase [Bacteroidota bacterium]
MALRSIRIEGDELLRKISKPVEEINDHIITLLEDMAETMTEANGVGLAAPQVGVLKRVVVIDVGDGVIELINPQIMETKGERKTVEGCLSVPPINGAMVQGEVIRPQWVLVKALNRFGEEIAIEGTELLATALCHEIDHLEGILFIDKAIRIINDEE